MANVIVDGPTTGYVRKVKIGSETYNFSSRVEYQSNLSTKDPLTGATIQLPEKGTSKITQLYSPEPNVWVTSAELGVDGKWRPLKKSESKDLLGNSYYSSSEGNEYVLGPSALKGLSSTGPNTLNNVSVNDGKVLYKKYTGLDNKQVNDEFNVSSNITSTGDPPLPSLFGPPSTTTPVELTPKDIDDPSIQTTKEVRSKYNDYYYPESLRGNQNKQDIIKFTAYSYVGRKLTVGDTSKNRFGSPGLKDRNFTNILGSVTLPIQPSITDTNIVQWGSEELNALQAFGAAASYGAAEDIGQVAEQVGKQIDGLFKQSNFKNAARIYLAGKAVGVNGLLSRVGGAVLNPNIELLFQGPQLRPFNFTFRLSPRDENEAQQVRYIIRFFKENMSVQNTADNIFLKAPNIFQINYLIRGEGDHPSLNRIKKCALQSFSVDYTPDGSYMTFNDTNATMTSYNLTLQFQELEPVTAKDYTTLNNENAIGY